MPVDQFWEWVLRLALAGALGALVGTERESRGHPAGIRTQALVALASALFTAVGIEGFSGDAADPTRVASQVATGIGFIGGGVILKYRGSVRGLTTAATLWLSAALGVAVGAGMIVPALVAAALAFLLIFGLALLKPFVRQRGARTLHVQYEPGHGTIGPLLRSLHDMGGEVDDVQVEDDVDSSTGGPLREVWIQIVTGDDAELERIADAVRARPEVHAVTMFHDRYT